MTEATHRLMNLYIIDQYFGDNLLFAKLIISNILYFVMFCKTLEPKQEIAKRTRIWK